MIYWRLLALGIAMLPAFSLRAEMSSATGSPEERRKPKSPPASFGTLVGKTGRMFHENRAKDDPIELEGRVWTLEKALARAMEANPEVLQARNTLFRQEGVYMRVRAGLFPTIDLVANASQRDQGLLDRASTEEPFVPSEQTSIAERNYSLRLQVRFLVYDGKSVKRQAEVQRLLGTRLYFEAQSTAYRIASIVNQAFDNLLYRRNVMRIHDETVETFEILAEQTLRRYEFGEIPELDTLRVQAELMSARADSARAESDLLRGEQFLRRTLNLPESGAAGSPLKTEGDLKQRDFEIEFQEARDRALAIRSDLLAAKAQVEAAEVGVGAAKSQYSPKIEGFADYQLNSSYFNSDIRLDGWMVGISGTWNLFGAGGRRGLVIANQAELRKSRLTSQYLENDITWRLRELYSILRQSRIVISAQETSVSFGERSVDQAQKMYEFGEASINDVLSAELSLRLSQIKLEEAIYSNNSAIAQVHYVIGGPSVETPFGESEVHPFRSQRN